MEFITFEVVEMDGCVALVDLDEIFTETVFDLDEIFTEEVVELDVLVDLFTEVVDLDVLVD